MKQQFKIGKTLVVLCIDTEANLNTRLNLDHDAGLDNGSDDPVLLCVQRSMTDSRKIKLNALWRHKAEKSIKPDREVVSLDYMSDDDFIALMKPNSGKSIEVRL
jgi:hypothetical protein